MPTYLRVAAAGLAGLVLISAAACSSNTTTAPAASGGKASASAQQQASTQPVQQTRVQTGKELSAAEVVQLAEPSIVKVSTTTLQGIGVGTGFVVDPAGYIITNNHVIAGASARNGNGTGITVTTSDGAQFDAKVVGTDPRSDLALLKIDATNLKALTLGNLENVVVGQDVLAIGYALDLQGSDTVTRGIVSAKDRSIDENQPVLGAIQTDAAINHGNSGGALVNTQGQLIGINTAILGGDGGGNVGIGFAIPSNLAKNIMNQLIEHGKVTRGYIGVYLGEITPNMRQAFGMSPDQGGVAITQVEPDSPGAKAGLKVEDVIVAMNGEKIDDVQAFRLKVASLPPGTTIHLKVLRNGSTVDVPVTLGVSKLMAQAGGPGRGPGQGSTSGLEGVQVQTLTPDIVQQLGLRGDVKGVIVTNVDAASAAAEAGLQPNDIIERVNRVPVTNTDEFENAVRQSNNPGGTLLLVRRGDARAFVVVPRK